MRPDWSAAKIVGVHTTKQSRDLSGRDGFSLAFEALKGAAADAGIDVCEIDGISSTVTGWPVAGVSPSMQATFWATQLGRPIRWTTAGSGLVAIADAVMAIEHGLASTVAIVVGMTRPPAGGAVAPWARPNEEFTAWTGSYTAVQYGLVAHRYIHEFGDRALEAMAEAAATIRSYGHVNPDAVYYGRGPFTAADVLASRPIASPLTLLMCSSVNDGGCAVIITRSDRARDTRKTPISVLAAGNQQPYAPYYEAPVLDAVPDEGAFVREAMSGAGLTHADIDVVEFYDHFAIGVLMEYEMFGFCDRGAAPDLVLSGAMRIDGRYPTCTDGGNLSFSHNGSPVLFRPIEAVRQLRGEVRDGCQGWASGEHSHTGSCRAVRDPRVAFVSNPGPPTGGNAFMVLTSQG
jgi:acetyl-CoA acetyltransferase